MVARNPFELFIFPAVNDPTMRQGITQSRSPSRFKDFDSVLHSLLKTICIRIFFLSLSIVNNRPSQIGEKKVRSSRNRNSFSKDRKCLLTQTRFFQTGRPPRWLLYLVSNPSPSIVWTFKSSRAVQFKSRPLRCSASSTHMAYAYFEREDSIHGIDDALKGWSIVGEKWIIASDPGGRGGRFWKRGSGCATAKQKSGQQVSSLGKGFRAASSRGKLEKLSRDDPSRE